VNNIFLQKKKNFNFFLNTGQKSFVAKAMFLRRIQKTLKKNPKTEPRKHDIQIRPNMANQRYKRVGNHARINNLASIYFDYLLNITILSK
jgi:hypothetical protein